MGKSSLRFGLILVKIILFYFLITDDETICFENSNNILIIKEYKLCFI